MLDKQSLHLKWDKNTEHILAKINPNSLAHNKVGFLFRRKLTCLSHTRNGDIESALGATVFLMLL